VFEGTFRSAGRGPRKRLLSELDEIGSLGFAIDDQEGRAGVRCIGFAVRTLV